MISKPVMQEDGLPYQFAKETFALPISHVIPGVNPVPICLAQLVVLDLVLIAVTVPARRVIVLAFSSET
tara:strand:- start:2404 stop:2610 length:207 start_codon:yes stop_codon:yes gene_type:complete